MPMGFVIVAPSIIIILMPLRRKSKSRRREINNPFPSLVSFVYLRYTSAQPFFGGSYIACPRTIATSTALAKELMIETTSLLLMGSSSMLKPKAISDCRQAK